MTHHASLIGHRWECTCGAQAGPFTYWVDAYTSRGVHELLNHPRPALATSLDQAIRILRALVGEGGAVRQAGPNPLDLDIDFDHLADVVHQARVFLYKVKGDV